MFNTLRREIEEILGDNFAVFFEYSTNPENNDKILNEYKNVGVLYVNYGDLKLLPGNQGLTGALQLDLLLSIKEGVELESVVSKPLYALLKHQNGNIYPIKERQNDGQCEDKEIAYRYVLNYHMPTSTGEIQTTAAGVEYVVYSLPIDVTVSTTLMMGDQFVLEVKYNGEYTKLNNASTTVMNPKLTLDPHTLVNGDNVTKSSAVARVWGNRVDILFDDSDKLHMAIYKALNENPDTVWDIRYSIDGTNYTERTVLFFDSTFTFTTGQFVVLSINMCEAA
ncbi:MAG: hypothetical protein J1G02_06365 [Clostridiales bacterium]|nr:hypothetical protein [Clostridiales bacterium]